MMNENIKEYAITGPFLLSFIINDEQRDILFNKNDEGYIESDGVTVWYVTKGFRESRKRYESITTANVIEVGLENESLHLTHVLDMKMETRKVQCETITLDFTITPTGAEFNDEDNE